MKMKGGTTTLSFDVGGSHIKAALLNAAGHLASERDKVDTPDPLTRRSLVDAMVKIARDMPRYDRIAVGIPGLVQKNVIYSLPAGGTEFKKFRIADRLTSRLGVPVLVTNDAVMHGLAVIKGTGIEMVITLGTGLGTALFIDHAIAAHYQSLPARAEPFGTPYGDEARRKAGKRKWRIRVNELIEQLHVVTNFDRLYVGGGNAKHLDDPLPRSARCIDAVAGVMGGHHLFEWGEVP